MDVVGAADAGVEPDAVVVHFGDAAFAETAMFAARRFGELACTADGARVVERAVVRIMAHLRRVVCVCDDRG